MNDYWGRTDAVLRQNGGSLSCHCGGKLYPEDDHGRFFCGSCGERTDGESGAILPPVRPIAQVDVSGMTDEEKAKIPLVHRLNGRGTAAEQRLARVYMKGPDAIGTKEYREAVEALEKERGHKP